MNPTEAMDYNAVCRELGDARIVARMWKENFRRQSVATEHAEDAAESLRAENEALRRDVSVLEKQDKDEQDRADAAERLADTRLSVIRAWQKAADKVTEQRNDLEQQLATARADLQFMDESAAVDKAYCVKAIDDLTATRDTLRDRLASSLARNADRMYQIERLQETVARGKANGRPLRVAATRWAENGVSTRTLFGRRYDSRVVNERRVQWFIQYMESMPGA